MSARKHRERALGHGDPLANLAHFGRAVRELRARRGLSQERLGRQSDLHRNYVGAIERGEINPTLRVVTKLCRGLRVPLSELATLYEDRIADGDP